MRFDQLARIAASFARTRYGVRFDDRETLESWQRHRIDTFLAKTATRATFYKGYAGQPLASLPVVDKATTLANFAAFNTRGITLETAYAAAHDAEAAMREPNRNTHPRLATDLSAGLSSGTSGRPGVFLASAEERATWAGILLARTLDRPLLTRLALRPAPLRVAFFLRANSALYTTIASRRIDFRFFDLHAGVHAHLDALARLRPDVLVAPASVLAWFAHETLAGRLPVQPHKAISVAEVLEPDDEAVIRAAYGGIVHQLYQCTEGFLGYTCAHGSLHLNEEFVHIEPEWLDAERTRFVPIVTDFTRRTQMIVRYRLDDILRVQAAPCTCGRVTRTLAAIDGRLDDVLWFASRDGGQAMPLFPDALRHAIARRGGEATGFEDYTLTQHGHTLKLAVQGDARAFDAIRRAVDRLIDAQGLVRPVWQCANFDARPSSAKRRRIVCDTRPQPDEPANHSVQEHHDA